MALKRGEVINNTYTIQFFIGQGAFGEVYRVKHKFLGLQVLKVLKADYVESSDLETLITEALLLSQLTHENVVRVFETNTFEKNNSVFYFLAMEFVSGESLSDLLKREITLPYEKAVNIQIDFLQGLEKAHSLSIIHRDINPDNILLSYQDEQVKGLLSDFGLAQKVNDLDKISGAAGRYLYFAPECFSNIYLPTSDVFSAGIVFYKILTGALPWAIDVYEHSSLDEIVDNILASRRKNPVPPSFYNSEIPEEIDKVVLKSLELKIENRYTAGGDFLEAITKAFNN
tara:strand:+ start:3637 stop:4494 length:858 start_codon:yes stop_codon:yes gene_type:complete